MRRLIVLSALVVAITAGCSSSEPLSIDFAWADAPLPLPVTITGAAVDEGVVCFAGTLVGFQLEDMDGNPVGFDEWGETIGNAMDTGSVAEIVNRAQLECEDGSGTITIIQHSHFDFAQIDIETFMEGGAGQETWKLAGTGEYESLSGSGDIVWNDGMIHAVGEVEA